MLRRGPFPIQPAQLLLVHDDALAPQHDVDAPVAEVAALAGHGPHGPPQAGVTWTYAPIAHAGAIDAQRLNREARIVRPIVDGLYLHLKDDQGLRSPLFGTCKGSALGAYWHEFIHVTLRKSCAENSSMRLRSGGTWAAPFVLR